jgi:hypothetical protein
VSDLLERVLEAHGGLDRWRRFSHVRATIVSGGELFDLKGLAPDATPRQMTVALHHEWASVTPFGAADQRTDFTPDRIAIEKLDGEVVAERKIPRSSFAGHELTTPWDPLHRAYFNGYAMWIYLTTPFVLTLPGVSVTEIAPVVEDGAAWPGLRADFPAEIATHSRLQEFYFGGTTTGSTWREASRPPSTSATSSRPTASGSPPGGGPITPTPTTGRSSTGSWSPST